jgi:MFS family permease
MNPMKRFYIDAFLQNIKNVAFFLFLPVLVAKLGASPFEIALSTSLPAFFCAFSLAFITRQLPLTYNIYYRAGILRQLVFLGMAFSPLLPHSIFWLLVFWAFNAMFVMVTSVQQQALIRQAIPESEVTTLFSRIKIIAITVTIVVSYIIGTFLDRFDGIFPFNYVISMVVGALATFTGMSLIAKMAPKEDKPIHLHFVRPLKTMNSKTLAVFIATAGYAVMGPLWTIYHVNTLQFSNLQIGLFTIVAGLLSTVMMPYLRSYIEKRGPERIILLAVAMMAVIPLFYSHFTTFGILLVFQVLFNFGFACFDVAQQTLAIKEAKKYENELDYFSDYQLVQNLANGLSPLIPAMVITSFGLHTTFLFVAILKIASILFVAFLLKEKGQLMLKRTKVNP